MTYRFNGQQVAVREGVTLTFVHGDHLGSASLTTGITGTKVSEMRYYPFGEVRYSSGNTPTDKRFTSQEEESSMGLYSFGARLYDQQIGRFISADSIVPHPGDPQAFNRYAYVRNSPLNLIDPNGHDWWNAVFNSGAIVNASDSTQLPALAVAASIAVQTNGEPLDLPSAVGGTNKTFGPGQVSVAMAEEQLHRPVSAGELILNWNTSIVVRAKRLAVADQEFLQACGSDCTKQMMTEDRWLAFALKENDQGLPIGGAWNAGDKSFTKIWNDYFKNSDTNAGKRTSIDGIYAYFIEQGSRSRDRYLIDEFASYLKILAGKGILPINIFGKPEDIGTTINFLQCMGSTGATIDGCR